MFRCKIIPVVLMALTLGGCAAFEDMFIGPRTSGEVFYISGPTPEDDADGTTVRVVPDTMDYNRLAGQYRNDSVQLFSLDQPGQSVSPIPAGQRSAPASSGLPSATDSSVTVFPFSDDMYTPGVHPGRRIAPSHTGGPLGYAPQGEWPMHGGSAPGTVYFKHGSAALDADARRVIADSSRNPTGRLVVEGHASQRAQTSDPVQRGLINLQMSMKRAMAVTGQLIKSGVPASSIKTTAYGDARLAQPEISRAAEAKNRRVEILTGGP